MLAALLLDSHMLVLTKCMWQIACDRQKLVIICLWVNSLFSNCWWKIACIGPRSSYLQQNACGQLLATFLSVTYYLFKTISQVLVLVLLKSSLSIGHKPLIKPCRDT